MAAIAVQGTGLRHVRKTINFDGSANNGNLGDDVPTFTLTGRVKVKEWTIYVSDALVCTDPDLTTLSFGLAGGDAAGGCLSRGAWLLNSGDAGAITDAFHSSNNNSGWSTGYGKGFPIDSTGAAIDVAHNLVINIGDDGGGADVTDGTIIIDLWYYPITDDGALAGDDIDTELIAAIRKQQMTELYAADGVAPTLEQAIFTILQVLTEASISGTTMTVNKLDGATPAFTLTLNDATDPTGITRAT